MLKSAVLQFDSPKYAQQSVIKDIKTIKELLKGEDYFQLRQKLNEVFGKKINDQQQQITIQQIQHQQQQYQQHQLTNSVRQRTSSNQEDTNQPKKQIFRRIYVAREIDKTQKEQPSLGEIKKINYTPLRNRQSRVKMNSSNIRQKTIEQTSSQQQQQSAIQQQCLPIIKSFVNMEEYQKQQQQIKKKKDQQKKKIMQNKFIEFDKVLNQLIK
ncbi:unnamed protein product [Paramecium sonneborni]|uniref:Uncharacterized protein n=1 Tax=Paramecium sonneborni TaxID=65129 RepID=A0A8S1LF18_9CILI|nr:unnamed protein product [Paramecium sonneborni]